MAKYKVLASAAHNYGASFISVMNNAAGDFTMCHLIRAAQSTDARELRVDLLTGTAEPPQLCPPGVLQSVRAYSAAFGLHLQRSGSALDLVSRAELRVTVRLGAVVEKGKSGALLHALLACDVVIVDDRGKSHYGRIEESWGCHPTKLFW
jgi:hypothetical protein